MILRPASLLRKGDQIVTEDEVATVKDVYESLSSADRLEVTTDSGMLLLERMDLVELFNPWKGRRL